MTTKNKYASTALKADFRISPIRLSLLLLVTAFSACSDSKPTRSVEVPEIDLYATMPGHAPIIVATVNGKPIHLSCVQNQIAEGELTKKDALEECINIELLIQKAITKGLQEHADVASAQKRESVRNFLEKEFSAKYPNALSLPNSVIVKTYKRMKPYFVHPEFRSSAFIRVKVPEKGQNLRELEQTAHERINHINDQIKHKSNITLATFEEIASEWKVKSKGSVIAKKAKPYARESHIVPEYRDALFAIPSPGEFSPPFRSKWGWDIVLLTKIHPEKNESIEQATTEIRKKYFPIWKEQQFLLWSKELSKNFTIYINNEALQKESQL